MPPNSNYADLFNINAHTTFHSGTVSYDIQKANTFDTTKPVYFVDVDRTLLDTVGLIAAYNHAFANYHPALAPDVWQQTYPLAKTSADFYVYQKHLAILNQRIQGNDQTLTELNSVLIQTLQTTIPKLIYSNLVTYLADNIDQVNFVLITYGTIDYQRLKIMSLLHLLPRCPEVCIYLENVRKGELINEFYRKFNLAPTHPSYIFDDNPDELVDIHVKCAQLNLQLIRVKQPNGLHNHRTIDLTNIIEWDPNDKDTLPTLH